VGTAQRRVAPVVVDELHAIVGPLPDTLGGTRDRALLVLGFAGAFRRSELVALTTADVEFRSGGLLVHVRRSKTDQEAQGVTVDIPFGSVEATCPVRTLRAWLTAAAITTGPLFRRVTAQGRVGKRALHAGTVAAIVKLRTAAAGLDPKLYSGHSLRAGLATSAAKAGKDDRAIMRQGRWTGRAMVDRYVRDAERFSSRNAAANIGL
jgi:integrase